MAILEYVRGHETVFVKTAYKLETTPGIADVTAMKALRGLTITPTDKCEVELFTPATGSLSYTLRNAGRKYSELSFTGKLTMEEGINFVTSIEMVPAVLKTMTIFSNGSVYAGCFVTEYTLEFTNKGIALTGKMLGRPALDAQTITAETYDTVKSFDPNYTFLFNGAEIKNAFSVKVTASNTFSQQFYLQQTPQGVTQAKPDISFYAKMAATNANKAFCKGPLEYPISIVCNNPGVGEISVTGNIFLTEPETESDEGGEWCIGMNGKFTDELTKLITVEIGPVSE